MKQFIAFAGWEAPAGGWSDFQGDADTELEAFVIGRAARCKQLDAPFSWWHVVNTETLLVVSEGWRE